MIAQLLADAAYEGDKDGEELEKKNVPTIPNLIRGREGRPRSIARLQVCGRCLAQGLRDSTPCEGHNHFFIK